MRVSVLRIVPEHRKDGRASLPVRPSRAAPVARKSDALLRPRPPGPCGLCVCTPVSRVCIKGFPYAVWLSLPVVFITHLCYGSRARRTVLTRVRLGASLATQHVDPRGGTGAFTPVSAYLAPQLSSSQECNTLELHAQQDVELQAQNIDEIS